jgi:hypothetical protein
MVFTLIAPDRFSGFQGIQLIQADRKPAPSLPIVGNGALAPAMKCRSAGVRAARSNKIPIDQWLDLGGPGEWRGVGRRFDAAQGLGNAGETQDPRLSGSMSNDRPVREAREHRGRVLISRTCARNPYLKDHRSIRKGADTKVPAPTLTITSAVLAWLNGRVPSSAVGQRRASSISEASCNVSAQCLVERLR